MSNVYDIWSGEPAQSVDEQKDIVKDMFESLIDFIRDECPTLPDFGVDATYDAVLEYIAEHDAR